MEGSAFFAIPKIGFVRVSLRHDCEIIGTAPQINSLEGFGRVKEANIICAAPG
jgi:hypothetical protein